MRGALEMARQGAGSDRLPRLAIPRRFHFMWFGGTLPNDLSGYVLSWLEKHPTWSATFWDESNLPFLVNQDVFDRADEIAGDCAGQLRADIARYEMLYRYGGVYVDCDFECQRSLEPLLDGVSCFAAWEEPGTWVNNAIMGCTPDHPLLLKLVHELPANVHRQQGNRPNKLSGPQFFTPVWQRYAAGDNAKPVTIFDKDLFYPYLYNELDRQGEDFPGAYAVHHWHNMRSKL